MPERGRDRLEDHGRGGGVDRPVEGVDVVEGHLRESGQVRPERVAVGRVACCHRQAGVPVVAAHRGDDAAAPRVGAGQLEGEVDRLATADPEHDPRQAPAGGGGEPFGQQRPPARHQVVVADVDVLERLAHGGHHGRVAVAEVEDATVAVAVVQPPIGVGVAEPCPAALAHHEIEPECLVGGHFAGVHVRAERRCGVGRIRVWLIGGSWRRHDAAPTRSSGVSGSPARRFLTRQ